MVLQDGMRNFLEQTSKLYNFDFQHESNVYVGFFKSLCTREQQTFWSFFSIYLRKANIEHHETVEKLLMDPLIVMCLKSAMEYYFL
jgi:hypothetical protein